MANATMSKATQSKESFPAGPEADAHSTLTTQPDAMRAAQATQPTLDADAQDPYDNVACTD
jgi:hypothetical protein